MIHQRKILTFQMRWLWSRPSFRFKAFAVKVISLLIAVLSNTTNAFTQSDTLSSSYAPVYKQVKPSLQYRYNYSARTHDYSNNWDLDGDGKADGVYFVGNGGAHQYFVLRIVLSSDKRRREYRYIQTDLPLLLDDSLLRNADFVRESYFVGFAAFDYSKDGVVDILIFVLKVVFGSVYEMTNETSRVLQTLMWFSLPRKTTSPLFEPLPSGFNILILREV